MKAVVFAYHEIGYVCLEELVDFEVEVLCLFTHEDSPGEEIWFRRPAEIAKKHNIPIYTPGDLKDPRWPRLLNELSPDIIFSFYYRSMIPLSILETSRIGSFNLHGSLLPKYRGRVPVNWVLVHGETKTGVTLHYMTEKPDAGDIIAQREVTIDFDDTAHTLFMKMTGVARLLMRDTLPSLKDGTFTGIPQVGPSSYFGGRKPEDGLIFWEKGALSIYNLVRAVTHPYPGAFTFLNGKKLFVWKAVPDEGMTGASPGTVVSVKPLAVSTGRGTLQLLRVQLEGEEETDGDRFAEIHLTENQTIGGNS